MGVPLMVAVEVVVGPTAFAVAVAGLTLTASPPPQAVRPNKTSANAQAALISLKSCTPRGVSGSGRVGRSENQSTDGEQANAYIGERDCAVGQSVWGIADTVPENKFLFISET
jgi:hypothetical protein